MGFEKLPVRNQWSATSLPNGNIDVKVDAPDGLTRKMILEMANVLHEMAVGPTDFGYHTGKASE
jgi:hypothetical protein